MFSGDRSVLLAGGNREDALRLASAALCLGNEKPCGLCDNCRRGEQAPDLMLIEEALNVERARRLREDVQKRPASGRRAVVVLSAHKMTPGAQNALLKTLEEPPEGTSIILVVDEAGLLPTVRSRCAVVRSARGVAAAEREEAARGLNALAERGDKAALARAYEECGEHFAENIEMQAELFARGMRTGRQSDKQASEAVLVLLGARTRLSANGNVKLTAAVLAAELGNVFAAEPAPCEPSLQGAT